MTETEYESVPLDKIRVGDWVQVPAFGQVRESGNTGWLPGEAYSCYARAWELEVLLADEPYEVRLKGPGGVVVVVRRSSITEVRRKVVKPEPKVERNAGRRWYDRQVKRGDQAPLDPSQ